MDAAVGEQAEQMQVACRERASWHQRSTGYVRIRRTRSSGPSCDVHVNDAARADIQMADLAISHLPLG